MTEAANDVTATELHSVQAADRDQESYCCRERAKPCMVVRRSTSRTDQMEAPDWVLNGG